MIRIVLATAAMVAAVLGTAGAQQQPPPLAAADYVEIETGYSRSLHTASERGLRYWITNLAIETSPTGALGWAYVVQARGLDFQNAALYRDEWVKTSDGWRLRHRDAHPGTVMPPRERYPPPSNIGKRTFTARDYFEIKNVATRYNVGYDNAAPFDGGLLSSLSFTNDAVFERLGGETRRGREGLLVQAKEFQKTGRVHHWDTTLLLKLGAEAVDTFNYLSLINVAPTGSPVQFGSGGPLAHRFVRSDEGWLMKFRRLEQVSLKPNATWPAPEFGLTASQMTAEPGDTRARSGHLSATDYVAIEQLYVREAIAFDRERGRVETWMTNMLLEPTKDGARGRIYVLKRGWDAAAPVKDVGTFEDELVKTREGWRFKKRVYKSEM